MSSTAQTYLIHFVNEDFVYSLQQKINQNYTNSYSTIVERILTRHLKVPNSRPSRGKSGINFIYPTEMGKDVIIPNLNPFDTLTWLAKRATSTKYKAPDFLFFENSKGYNFAPVSYLWEKEPQWTINVKPKNISNDVAEYIVCEYIDADLQGLNIILIDELVSTGNTISQTHKYLKNRKGVNNIYTTTVSFNKTEL